MNLLVPFTLVCYLYGGIPFAFVFTYLATRERIYTKGSRNVGVANAFHAGGLVVGFLTVCG
jgi:glycerol-3-phosphate acyltransferase PlsY